jgi:RNA ligase (TIGR02306 family)
MRNLVSIKTITDVNPIPNADMIECITIDGGWKVVSKKNEFKPGDACIYFEIDSVLPIRPEFEFLRKSSYIKTEDYEGFRLKTIRLRGQISQGLALPIHVFENDAWFTQTIVDDLTEKLGVIKWEPKTPAILTGDVAGPFPSYVPKTDQERIQNLASNLEDYSYDKWEVTEKMEGQSLTVFNYKEQFGVCSRNWMIKENEENAQWKLVRSLKLKEKMNGLNIAIQGEFVGPGVQGNHYGLKEHKFMVFDMYDIDLCKYMNSRERLVVCQDLGLHHVPVVNEFNDVVNDMEAMLQRADGNSRLNPNSLREGLVYKSIADPSKSFKTVSNEYLLKEK